MKTPSSNPRTAKLMIVNEPLSDDALMGLQLQEQWDKVVNGQRDQLVFGAMMLKLREHISGARAGVHPGGAKSKGTGIEGWLKQHAPKVSERTARRMMDVVEGIALSLKLGKGVDVESLLEADAETLSKSLAKKRAEFEKVIEGKSQRQLLLDFGKPAMKRKGGDTSKAAPKDDAPPEKPADWTQEQWERYLGLSPEMRRAVDLWRTHLDFLHRQTKEDETAIPHLPKAEREELAAINRQLGKFLSATK